MARVMFKCGSEGEGCGGKFAAFSGIEIEDENVDVGDEDGSPTITAQFTVIALCNEEHQFASLEIEEYHTIEEGDPCHPDPHSWEVDAYDISCEFATVGGRKSLIGGVSVEYSCPKCGRSHEAEIKIGPVGIGEFEPL